MNNPRSDEDTTSVNQYRAYIDEIAAGNTPINQPDFGEHTNDVETLISQLKGAPQPLRESVLEACLDRKPGLSALYNGTVAPPEQKTLINLRELRNRPRPQWVIDGFIYENTIIELYAEAGCYTLSGKRRYVHMSKLA